MLRAEGLLIFIMLHGFKFSTNDYNIFLLFYLLAPIIQSGFNWARLFYFDSKKLENKWLHQFHIKLKKGVFTSSIWIGLTFWLMSLILAYLYFHKILLINWLLLPFFLLRSITAYLQIVAFSRRHYYDVLISGLFVFASIILIRFINLSLYSEFSIVILGIALSTWYILKPKIRALKTINVVPQILPFYQWAMELKNNKNPIKIHFLKINRKISGKVKNIFLQLLANKCSACKISKTLFLCYQSHQANNLLNESWLAKNSNGIIINYSTPSIHNNRQNALEYLFNINKSVHEHIDYTIQLIDKFHKEFPEGFYLNLEKKPKSKENTPPFNLSKNQLNELFYQLIRFSHSPLATSKSIDFFVTSTHENRRFKLLFTIPKKIYTKNQAHMWLKMVRRHNLSTMINSR